MSFGKLCPFSADCTVYNDNNNRIKNPVFLVRNVFCNRGIKGWVNCKRYKLLQKGETIEETMIPTD